MNITSNMTVTPDPAAPNKRWFLTMAYAGQMQLHLNIRYTKGSEHHWTYNTEIQEAGNWYTLSQRGGLDWQQHDGAYYRLAELPDSADAFRLIIEEFIDPAADMSATGTIDIRAQLT